MRRPVTVLTLATLWLGGACTPWGPETPTISARSRTTASLRSFESCDALEAELRANLREEMRVQLMSMQNGYWGRGGPEAAMDDSAGGAPSSNQGGRQEGVDYSGTNNQEQGVDEADFVKTDGYYIYTLNGNRLEILGVPEFGQLTQVSSTQLEGYPGQMLLGENKAVIFSSIYTYNLPADHPLRAFLGDDNSEGYWYWRSGALTKITVLDLADRAQPEVIRELYLEGYYQTARKVLSSVRMVSYSWMDVPDLRYWPELPEAYYQLDYQDPRRDEMWRDAVAAAIRHNDAVIAQLTLSQLVPQIYERFASGEVLEHPFTTDACGSFATADDAMSRGFTSILSLDLLGPAFAFDADHVVSTWSTVYASTDTLIVAEPSFDWWWYWNNDGFEEVTNLHRFDISQAGRTTYTGSGRIPGLVRNQFSLSERDGVVRVATTTGQWQRWWMENPDEPANLVYTLAGEAALQELGHIGGIAVGEQIWAARFIGERGYLVTFRNTDPLWTIDLSDPRAPRLVGELEVPGVSTYIHPLDDNHLLTIGYGGDDSGLDWSTSVSIFDVTDFSAPRRSSVLSLAPEVEGDGWTYAWSEATWEHKAFQYWGPMNMLAIPLSTYRSVWTGDYRQDYHYEYFSRLQLINVDTGAGLSLYGQVDHSDFFNRDAERYWDWRDVRRSIFMGDFIYAISDRGVTASRISDLSLSASVELPGSDGEIYWVD